MFSEILINNREKLKEAESFVLTLQKDKTTPDKEKKNKCEENIKFKYLSGTNPYSKVVIELKDNCPINQIKEILSKREKQKLI